MEQRKPRINVCLLQPPGYIHALALLEAAEYVVEKAVGAGYEAKLSKNRILPTGLNVVFGAHINPKETSAFPANTVIFNTEQLPEKSAWINSEYNKILERSFVWDYSPVNLAIIPHDRKQLVCFYYTENLNRIIPARPPEYDLIFYGSINDRRKKILGNLSKVGGLKLLTVFGLYGPERDALLVNARAMLNLHYYDAQIFQQIRAFYALTNGIPVISENFPLNSAPAIYGEALFTPGTESIESYTSQLLQDRCQFKSKTEEKINLFRATKTNNDFKTALERTIDIVLGANAIYDDKPQVPARINLGSGKDYRVGYLNIDINSELQPDVVLDLAAVIDLPLVAESAVYGKVNLEKNCFDEIVAYDVLEHIPNLLQLMTNCLNLLKEGGKFVILVPYDLALGAWQDPTHVRAFNENSWLYYTDWFWYLGWFDYCFDRTSLDINLSELGKVLVQKNVSQEEILRTPRAIDSMKVVLSKRETTPQEKTLARAFSNNLSL